MSNKKNISMLPVDISVPVGNPNPKLVKRRKKTIKKIILGAGVGVIPGDHFTLGVLYPEDGNIIITASAPVQYDPLSPGNSPITTKGCWLSFHYEYAQEGNHYSVIPELKELTDYDQIEHGLDLIDWHISGRGGKKPKFTFWKRFAWVLRIFFSRY